VLPACQEDDLGVLARVPLASDRKRYLNRTIRDNFSARPVSDRVLEISVSDQGGKTFMDADVIAAIYPGYVLLLQQHPIHEEGAWAPDEKAQVYAHPTNATNVPEGRSYYELEFCAPVLPPNRVNKAPLRVTYKLIKRRAQTTDEQIVEMIESIAWKR